MFVMLCSQGRGIRDGDDMREEGLHEGTVAWFWGVVCVLLVLGSNR